MARQLRVPGHTLPHEGRILGSWTWSSGPGRGVCSCGEESPEVLPSTAARQRWHREHKETVVEFTREGLESLVKYAPSREGQR